MTKNESEGQRGAKAKQELEESPGVSGRITSSGKTRIVKKSFQSGNSKSFASKSIGGGSRKTDLVKAVWEFALESNESNPTVVVWIFDQTESAKMLCDNVAAELNTTRFGETNVFGNLVVGFSEQGVEFHADQPLETEAEFRDALKKIKTVATEKEHTFATLGECLDRIASLHTESRKSIVPVLITDETGDDAYETVEGRNRVDRVLDQLKRLDAPLFVIGYAAPFGRKTDRVDGADDSIVYGPETAMPERIDLGLWNGSTDLFRYDSGFGPYNLERLCRGSGGRYLAQRPEKRSMRLVSRMQSNWPASTSMQFDETVMSRYRPKYVSLEEYMEEINSNKAKLALHQAAKLSHTQVFRVQNYEFRATSEAAMARQVNMVQRTPAIIQPGLEKLESILKTGEADRDLLDSDRWRASFDLAYGRTLANQVRVVGLNAMLAEIKGGKPFSNPENNSWTLVPSDEISTGTKNRKRADKAISLLQGVVRDHPGTPWASIAKKELESPLGWEWMESRR